MNQEILTNFTVDKSNTQILVERDFNAPISLVWRAWTEAELLDQWWAPKPYQAVTKSQKFENGGIWHYYMQGPEGDRHWCLAEYSGIDPLKKFNTLDAFCDEHCTINDDFPRSSWSVSFSALEQKTRVHIVISYQQLSDLERIIELGFREGFNAAIENLHHLLNTESGHVE